jgi:glycosyltransferase involved in cell wall biosynthesis
MNKLKICHVVSADITVKFLLMGQLRFLVDEGYQVHVVTPSGKWVESLKRENLKIHIVEISRRVTPLQDIITLLQLFFYLKKEKFDIVHTHAPKPGLLGQVAAKMAGVPIIANTIHGLYFSENSSWLKKTFFVFVEKIAAKCSDVIFSQNKEDMETLVRERIAPVEKITYLGNGVDVDFFNSERFSDDAMKIKKKDLGLPLQVKVIGIVGRLVKEKGYLDLFEAFGSVLKKYPDTVIMAIGPEEPNKKDKFSKAIVKEYGIADKAIFLGERSDMDQLYPLMDVFILPSWREGFPRSIIEAMAEKRPIIATNIRGCREAIENGKTGLLIPVKSPAKLSEAILYLLDHPQIASTFANNANMKALKDFNEQLVFERIKKGYQALIEKKL